MLTDLLQSKNAPAALILLVAGTLLAVVLPAMTDFPGWTAGMIGLAIGAIAGLIVLQGRGANRDELLALRTAIKGAQRGERAARSAALSSDLGEVFAAIDDVAAEIESRHLRLKEGESAAERARGEIAQRDERWTTAGQELGRSLEGLTQLVMDQLACADQLALSARQAQQVLESASDDLDQLATRADSGSAALSGLAADSDDVGAAVAALAVGVRETSNTVEALAQELRSWEPSMRGLQVALEGAAAAQRESERRAAGEGQASAAQAARLMEQLQLDAERGSELVDRSRAELERIEAASIEASAAITGLGARLDALQSSLEGVDDLTEQMTLLGLNAAIIAAQAGEHGKGFTVVADGMKDLADRAQVADKQLSGLIAPLAEQVKLAIRAIERGAGNVERGGSASLEAALAARRTFESAQRAAATVRELHERSSKAAGNGNGDESIERALSSAAQLAASISHGARELAPLAGQADVLRGSAQQLERRHHEQTVRGRQLASQIEAIARALEQLSKSHRAQRRALDESGPALDSLRELIRDHESRLTALAGVTAHMQRPSGRSGA